MKKIVMSFLAGVFLSTHVSAATMKENFTEDETLRILSYMTVSQELCGLQVKQEDFNAWIYSAMQYGYSFEQLNQIMAFNVFEIFVKNQGGDKIDNVCAEISEKLYKELYIQ